MRGDRPRCITSNTWRTGVSPACAGIDPCPPWVRSRFDGLPRVRGDRPGLDSVLLLQIASPPRARGSTLKNLDLLKQQKVSPACAGIDPDFFPIVTWRRCLPRVRGDRPLLSICAACHNKSPPRARGSTRRARPRAAPARVSPACAGIDPMHYLDHGTSTSLPRVRGDRPERTWTHTIYVASPPRARGSTASKWNSRKMRNVSPACAGIDLRSVLCFVPGQGLPRVRGDRPVPMVGAVATFRSPPRARGSTLSFVTLHYFFEVSPACAGIDPTRSPPPCHLRRLPRVRGDRPRYCSVRFGGKRSPPRARGSTLCRRPSLHDHAVSPACAGIDL